MRRSGPPDGRATRCARGCSRGGVCSVLCAQATRHASDPSVAHLLDMDSWQLIPTDVATTPQQENGSDCGVFTCVFANYLSLQLRLDFSAADMFYFRQRITLDILKKATPLFWPLRCPPPPRRLPYTAAWFVWGPIVLTPFSPLSPSASFWTENAA